MYREVLFSFAFNYQHIISQLGSYSFGQPSISLDEFDSVKYLEYYHPFYLSTYIIFLDESIVFKSVMTYSN